MLRTITKKVIKNINKVFFATFASKEVIKDFSVSLIFNSFSEEKNT